MTYTLRNVTVATESPIGGEVLLMSGVDLSRFEAGAVPVLVDHVNSARAVVGSVLDLRVEGDRLVADMTITDPDLSAALERGQHFNTSIGYETAGEYQAPDGTTVARNWTIYECSLCGVGADPATGTDRKESEPVKTRTTTEGNQPAPTPAPAPAPAPNGDDGAKSERERVRSLMDMGREYDVDPREAIVAGDTPEAFALAIRQKATTKNNGSRRAPATVKRDNIGDPEDEFSFRKLILSMADGEACRELERTEGPATVGGSKRGGRHIPGEVMRLLAVPRQRGQRVLTQSGNQSELVGTDHLGGEFIEPLREMAFSGMAGVRILDGLMGNVEIPRQSAVSTATWFATETDAADMTASEPDVDEIELSPKESGVMGVYSRRLMIQSDPSVEAFVREDQNRTLALAVDKALLSGSGAAGQPKGVDAYSASELAAKVANTNGTEASWAAVLNLKGTVAAANAGTGAYVMHSVLETKLEGTPKETGYPRYVIDDDGMLARRPYYVSNLVASKVTKGSETSGTTRLYYGNWADAVIARWSGIDVIVDNLTLSGQRKIRVLSFQDIDCSLRHPASFGIIEDAKHL